MNTFPSFRRNLSHTGICPWLSLHLQPEEQKRFFCSWVGFLVGNVSDIGSKMECVGLHPWHKACAIVTADFCWEKDARQIKWSKRFNTESRVNLCISADNDCVLYCNAFVCQSQSIFFRRGFLGQVFSRKSQPFMCMYKSCMHVIKPMQITAFTCAREIWTLIFAKGKRMRPDLKARQCDAFRTTILQWLIGELLSWG